MRKMKKSEPMKQNLSEADIAMRAYHLWEINGRPNGRALEHWLEAETQLRNGLKYSWPPAAPASKPGLRGNRYGLVLQS